MGAVIKLYLASLNIFVNIYIEQNKIEISKLWFKQ